MPRLQIDLDTATSEALSSLAGARGTTPAALVAELIGKHLHIPAREAQPAQLDAIGTEPPSRQLAPPDSIDALVGRYDEEPVDEYRAPPDPMDELVGKYRGDLINDTDEVVYGR